MELNEGILTGMMLQLKKHLNIAASLIPYARWGYTCFIKRFRMHPWIALLLIIFGFWISFMLPIKWFSNSYESDGLAPKILELSNWNADVYKNQGDVPVLIVAHKEWIGIRSASIMLGFPLVLRDDASGRAWDNACVNFVLKWGIPAVIINGFPPRSLALASRLSKLNVDVSVIYHGSFVQHVDNMPELVAFGEIIEGIETKIVKRLGLVKHEMVEVVRDMQLPAYPVSNMVHISKALQGIRMSFLDGKLHIGVLGGHTFGKNVITQIMAACTIHTPKPVVVHILELKNDLPYIHRCSAEIRVHKHRKIAYFQRLLSQMDLNLYVSMHECQPMVALESMAAGVPCIISDTSTLYETSDMLHNLLVCSQQDAADRIHECIERVLPFLGGKLSSQVREYVQFINQDARQKFADLLEKPVDQLFQPIDNKQSPLLQTVLPRSSPSQNITVHAMSPMLPCNSLLSSLPVSVLLVTYELATVNQGGAGTVIHALAREFTKSGTRIIILADIPQKSISEYVRRARADGISESLLQVISLPSVAEPSRHEFDFVRKSHQWAVGVEAVLSREYVDIVEFFEYAGPAAILLSRRLQGISQLPQNVHISVRIHGSLEFIDTAEAAPYVEEREIMYRMERFAMTAADTVLAPSHGIASLYIKALNLQPRLMIVAIPPVIASLQDLTTQPGICRSQLQDRRLMRAKLTAKEFYKEHAQPHSLGSFSEHLNAGSRDGALPETDLHGKAKLSHPFRFLVLGKMQQIKNPVFIVKAAVNLLNNGFSNFTLEFFGLHFSSGKHMPNVFNEVKRSIPDKWSDHFKFHPPVDRGELVSLACQFDAALVASLFESFNMVAHELHYLGIPLIISDFVGFKSFFNESNAHVFARGSLSSLEITMIKVLQGNDVPSWNPLLYDNPVKPYACMQDAWKTSTDVDFDNSLATMELFEPIKPFVT
eukprot:gene5294-7066_t